MSDFLIGFALVSYSYDCKKIVSFAAIISGSLFSPSFRAGLKPGFLEAPLMGPRKRSLPALWNLRA